MRLVIVGAGAVGGVLGGRLAAAGADVVLVARGEHGRTIAETGLRILDPDSDVVVRPRVVGDLAAAVPRDHDAVVLAVKSQHTAGVLADLAATGADPAVVCLQNGVDNERQALRRFGRVCSVPVMCPTLHLEPGVVVAYSAPVAGILDIGRWPDGLDDTVLTVSAAFTSAGFESVPRPDIARWKYTKLLVNLGNAIEAVCGPQARTGPLGELARAEGEAVLTAAGIPFASAAEDADRRGDTLRWRPVAGVDRPGGSSWQSLARATGSIETDYINGEIVLLSRLYGVPAPVNTALAVRAVELARTFGRPGSVPAAEVLAAIAAR
jgi:2-dehydropantoate 2-reductase